MSDKKLKILLVEDNDFDIELIDIAFEETLSIPYSLKSITDGEKAIDYLHEIADNPNEKPDLILLDINLPRKDGFDVLSDVKSTEGLKATPVIMLTSSESATDITKAYGLHANSYLTKPWKKEDFNVIIQSIESFWFKTCKLPLNSL